MPLASLALLLSPLLQCLHFPVSGPCPQSPFSLLTPLPSLFPISLLTSLPSLLPGIPSSRRPQQGPSTRATSRRIARPGTQRNHPRGEPATCPHVPKDPGDPAASNHPPLGRFHAEPVEPHPVHTERHELAIPPTPSGHPTSPSTSPAKAPFGRDPTSPQNRQKSAPRRLKSFLEKTLTARETPNSPPPKAARSQTPHHSASASSSLALWERVGVRVFRSKRCPAAPAGASTPIRRRPTVPNPAHLAATTGDNRMADPLPRRTR